MFGWIVWADAADRYVFLVVSTLNAYVSIGVDLNDWEWSLSGGGEFCFPFAFIRFLYNEYSISYFVVMLHSGPVFFLVVGNGVNATSVLE